MLSATLCSSSCVLKHKSTLECLKHLRVLECQVLLCVGHIVSIQSCVSSCRRAVWLAFSDTQQKTVSLLFRPRCLKTLPLLFLFFYNTFSPMSPTQGKYILLQNYKSFFPRLLVTVSVLSAISTNGSNGSLSTSEHTSYFQYFIFVQIPNVICANKNFVVQK